MTLPPPLPARVRERLLAVYAKLQEFTQGVVFELGDQMLCREGCDRCCRQRLALRSVEAAYFLEGARQLDRRAVSLVWQSLATGGCDCPLLQGGVCLSYEHRPAVCRTHGLPLLRREDGQPLLHHCPLNFSAIPAEEMPAALVLDELRLTLLLDAVDAVYCQETQTVDSRLPIEDLLRVGLQP